MSPSSTDGVKSWRDVDDGVMAAAGSSCWPGECCCTVVRSLVLAAAARPSGVGGNLQPEEDVTAVSLRALIELL